MKLNLTAVIIGAMFASQAFASDLSLRMGNEGTYPPFSITKPDGSLTGLEPDLARELCKRLEADCDLRAYEFKALLPSLMTGKIDIIVSQLTPKPERLENSEFTDPILTNPTDWIVPVSWQDTVDAASLDGKTVGAIKGSWFLEPVRENAPGAKLKLYDNINQIALDLTAGRIDGVIGGRINWARKFADSGLSEDYKLVANTLFEGGDRARSWAVAKGNTDLRDRINSVLEDIFADCTYTKIRKQYIPVSVSSREPERCQ